MLVEFKDITGDNLDCDLCIIGAGAAGITLALQFAGSNTRVILLEAGGRQVEADTQALYKGSNIGHPYYKLEDARLRAFGGSTGHWGGACWPLEPGDFAVRHWVQSSGWPVGRAELDPYYEKAQQICQAGPFNYDPHYWQEHETPAPLLFTEGDIETRFYHNSPPTRFGSVYRDDLARARNVTAILHANVTHLQLAEDGRALRQVDVASLEGRKLRVNARRYVLACGGLENPRLLLSADDVAPNGIGNRHDLVGRYFMDHPVTYYAGTMLIDGNVNLRFYTRHTSRSRHIRGGLRLSDQLQRTERLLDCWISLDISGASGQPDGWRPNVDPEILPVPAVQDYITDVENLPYSVKHHGFHSVRLLCHSEQSPNPDSRVTLETKRDALGMRRLKLDWRLTDYDRYSVHRTLELLGMELGAHGMGRIRIDLDGDLRAWSEPDQAARINHPWGSYHHIGTTRMHDDPKQGVVDRHCRVHDVDNLYIAGSSVFPTCGYANPTLTIVALACRLGDHLKSTLG